MSDSVTPEYETVLYEVDDRVATVTLNRPEVHNALSFQLRSDIVAALRRAEQDPDVSLVLLKGAGRSFCAGYDLKVAGSVELRRAHDGWVADEHLEDWTDQFSRGCVRDWMTLWQLLKPVVAQVHGNCLAGGLELMSMADIVFVADDTRLGYPPMRGMSTPDTVVFPWKMSMAQAKYVQISGNSVTGAQAAEWGWVVKSFPADELEAEVAAGAARAAQHRPVDHGRQQDGGEPGLRDHGVPHPRRAVVGVALPLEPGAGAHERLGCHRRRPHDPRLAGVDEPRRRRGRAALASGLSWPGHW